MSDRLKEDVERARLAQSILENPLFIEAMDAIRDECQAKWMATTSEQTERRERIWLMLKLAEKFRMNIESHLSSGALAQAEIAELNDAEKRKRFGIF